jgi:isoleucyl-tRNA synthetase
VTEVGDCWLDAGIVPYSTLNYLPDHLGYKNAIRSTRSEETTKGGQSAWQRWFPADFITEMREQVRLWFYSMLFMSVTLEDKAPYLSVLTYEEMRDEKGNPFSKSGGNAIPFDEAAEKMGADPMRWLYAAAPLNQVFRFGYGPADEVKRKMLTLWNCYKFFTEYANLDTPALRVTCASPQSPAPGPQSELDRWILARLQQLITLCNDRLEHGDSAAVTREVEKFIDDLSTWYVRQSRRRFWKSEDDADKAAAYQTLYDVLTTLSLLIAPILPFTAEEMYQNLVRSVDANAPESVHLCAYPHGNPAWQDDQLVEDVATLRRVVSLALAARNEANVKVRQPLPRLLVKPASAHERDVLTRMRAQLLHELNVKRLEFVEDEAALQSVTVKPHFAKLGPKYGKRVPQIQRALAAADAHSIAARVAAGEAVELSVDGEPVTLAPEDLSIERKPAAGLVVVSDNGCLVALDTTVTPELVHEGMARDFVRHVQELRKKADFHVADRIAIRYVADSTVEQALRGHADYIRQETLADELAAGELTNGAVTTTLRLGERPVQISILRTEKAKGAAGS